MTVHCAQCAHYIESFFWCALKRSVRPHEDFCSHAEPKDIKECRENKKENEKGSINR